MDLDRPEDPLDPGQEPGERGWSLRGPRALAHLCHWSLPCYVPRDVTQGFQPICPVPCGHALSPQATRPASDCPSALVSCPPTPQHHEGVLVTVGALHLLCQGAPLVPPCFSLLAHACHPLPFTGPGSPGGSSPPRRQWWRPWLDHATGTTPTRLPWPHGQAVVCWVASPSLLLSEFGAGRAHQG